MAGEGDKLARGLAKAQFPPAGNKLTEEQWNELWEGYNTEEFLAKKTGVPKSGKSFWEQVRKTIDQEQK